MTGDEAFWAMPDGGFYIQTPHEGAQIEVDAAWKRRVEQELDLLYRLGGKNGLVTGGVSPQPTATTQDGHIAANDEAQGKVRIRTAHLEIFYKKRF